MKHPRLTYLAFLCALAGLFVGCGELIVRLRGGEPWRVPLVRVLVEPGGKFFAPHPTRGYTHLPGRFDVTLKGSYKFGVTHGPDGLRITQSNQRKISREVPEIWIFGGSFTHGWSINDHETYVWLLQSRFPGHRVVNFGVDGYGTIHALVQFREELERRPAPAIAVIAYASFHDTRNTFLRQRRKTVASLNALGPLRQPYARLDDEGNLELAMADVVYRPLPGMRKSALLHLIEQTYNRFENARYDSREVTRAIIDEFHRLADQHQVEFVVAGISRGASRTDDATTEEMLAYASSRGIYTADISVDMTKVENVNLPHDFHPSPLANQRYAEKLATYLREQSLVD